MCPSRIRCAVTIVTRLLINLLLTCNGLQEACTKTWNAGMPERRNTKTRNTKLLKPGTHEKYIIKKKKTSDVGKAQRLKTGHSLYRWTLQVSTQIYHKTRGLTQYAKHTKVFIKKTLPYRHTTSEKCLD